ncbi:hypothetical protein BUALT_Bualt02G0187800 [Buddleja alternifolia]|uniref:Uncharacterized protein n=1 Tax=Buddleja alternifolia TaxID=168488 RepID=A0AAV6Y3H1_9LAMI|nr:hypothetical protein BUALT_Bualt02G0187800 [Buddleja alternifolia]
MEFDDEESGFGFGSGSLSALLPPALVSLTPFTTSASPSPRRLSSCFTQPKKPVRAKRQLAWVSLQGRLVGAEEASSVTTIDRNGVFSSKEAVAWEMFTPIQRVMIVAIVSAAAMNSKKNKQIFKLQKSVEFRDQVLLSMQEKLDNLCEQVNYFKDQPEVAAQRDVLVTGRGCKLCQHHNLPQNSFWVNTPTKGLHADEVFQNKMPHSNETEPEERRMSDLSDWAPSVTSSVDIQLDTFATEHDINDLLKECEEKDVTIRELSSFLHSSEVLGSKRITELEDIIRRKNMIIHKLRKDILVLEQKVVNLTRLRRSSLPTRSSNVHHFPIMADNVLYDMDSTTGPSSSDSDSPPKNRIQAPGFKSEESSVQNSEKASKGDLKCGQVKSSTFIEQNQSVITSPLKEKSMNHTPNSVSSLKPKHIMSSASGENRSRRRPPVKSKEVAVHKRWA